MAPEPESLDLQLLRDMRAEIADMRAQMSTKSDHDETRRDIAELKSESRSDMHSLRADMAADLLATRKDLGEQIVGLRRAVIEYHTSVIGHGMIGHGVIIGELESQLRKVEQHLNLS